MKRLPIKAAKEVARAYKLRQVILVAWDGAAMHVVTYGTSVVDCDHAAQGGNIVKRAIKFPEALCVAEPQRVVRMRDEISRLLEALEPFVRIEERLRAEYDSGWAGGVPSADFIDGPWFAGALTLGQIRDAARAAVAAGGRYGR